MKYLVLLFLIIFLQANSNAKSPIIDKSEHDKKLNTQNGEIVITPIELPGTLAYPLELQPISKQKIENTFLQYANTVLFSDSTNEIITPGAYKYFIIDTKNKNISQTKTSDLSSESEQAIKRAPLWLADQLRLKFNELRTSGVTTEKQYANLILTAGEKQVDEVAFTIANMSYQSLTDSRFISDKEAILRNAEMIYKFADSLKYVKLVEHKDEQTGDYYTTTTYRIYDPVLKDTIWSEIPKEIYYWYIVHPKMDQEGVYVKDNSNDASGQRTYGFAWRDFIWNNPDPAHNYTNVNKTTTKGSILTIPRFGELIKSAEILWDRNQTYYTFNRPFTSSTMALDIIGNWCSRAIPVDVTLPRAFQPNQILMKHDGMCNEDAFLVAATCRTALIPIIYLGTWSEDHVFGSVWDKDWNHFEFFRGGLAPSGNQFYGITNMLPGGSYGWKNAMVEGFRPDGYAFNFTSYYAKTAKLKLKVLDSKGNPIEGALINLFSSPNGSTSNYLKCGTAYTDLYGNTEINVGEQKKFLAQVWHPKYGWAPTDSTKAYVVLNTNAVAGSTYSGNLAYETAIVSTPAVTKIGLPPQSNYAINLKIKTQGILTGRNARDGQRSRFYFWNDEGKGLISAIICDSLNFVKFQKKEQFYALESISSIESGDFTFAVPEDSKWYLILSNHLSDVFYEKITANVDLLEGQFTSVPENVNSKIEIYPNPFTEKLKIELPNSDSEVSILDVQGRIVTNLSYPFIWEPENLSSGIFTILIKNGKNVNTQKVIYIK